MENENKDVTAEPSLKIEDRRQEFMSRFDETHEAESEPSAFKEETDSKQESESEGQSVNADRSDSSSVKEEVKGGTKKESEAEKPSADVILENNKKALHEEREKRKQANLKRKESEIRLQELQRQYDEKLKDMEKRLEDLSSRAKEPEISSDSEGSSDETEIKVMRQRFKEMEAKQRIEEDRRKEAEFAENQKKIQEAISTTDKKLKEEGFPGFRWAAMRVDQELKRMYDEGELEQEELNDPKVWADVYKSRVYDEVAAEFKLVQKKETFERKIEQKKAAAKSAIYPGAKPTIDVDSDEEPETDDIQEYFEFKKKNAARRPV